VRRSASSCAEQGGSTMERSHLSENCMAAGSDEL
jgi:hypothetical protein